VGASEREEWLRAAWQVMVAEDLKAEHLIFVDEMGANTSLAPLYACSRKGEREHALRCRATGGRTSSPCWRA
jgi:hypothetical protein